MQESKAVATRSESIIELVITKGDLAELTPGDRVIYYTKVCESLGLNPLTRPFEYIKLNNKLTLYARREATDQLRSIRNVSIAITGREMVEGVYIVTAKAAIGDRADESTGAVDISNLKGEFRANAMMKAETKAKRRVTLSIVGLGWLDESELADIPRRDVQIVQVNAETGEVTEKPTPAPASPVEHKEAAEEAKTGGWDSQKIGARIAKLESWPFKDWAHTALPGVSVAKASDLGKLTEEQRQKVLTALESQEQLAADAALFNQ